MKNKKETREKTWKEMTLKERDRDDTEGVTTMIIFLIVLVFTIIGLLKLKGYI